METTLPRGDAPTLSQSLGGWEIRLIVALMLTMTLGLCWLAYYSLNFKEHYKSYPPGSQMLLPELVAKAKAERLQSLRLSKHVPGGSYNALSGRIEGAEYSFKQLPRESYIARLFTDNWMEVGFEIDLTGPSPRVTVSEVPKTLQQGLVLQAKMEKAIALSLKELEAHRLEKAFRETGTLPPRKELK